LYNKGTALQKTADDIIIFLLVTTAIIVVMAGFVITIVLLYRRKQITHLQSMETMKSEYEKTILNTQLEIQEQTFINISREIHDNIGMSLSLAKLNLNTLKSADPETAGEQINSSINLISKAINDLADISKGMNADFIAEYGLINAAGQEINRVKNTKLYNVTFTIEGEPIFMSSQKELIIFRIIQEALNNILKHAQAKIIAVRLNYEAVNLAMQITDDGIGFSSEKTGTLKKSPKGTGLINMQNRALLLGGTWNIESSTDGTTINLTVPY
jgi:two-component system, NarL family, sensor kinase